MGGKNPLTIRKMHQNPETVTSYSYSMLYGGKKSLSYQKNASKSRNCYFLLLFNVIHARIPYILVSNPHPFYSFRGLKTRCGLELSAD
jgi:hypothetical protein